MDVVFAKIAIITILLLIIKFLNFPSQKSYKQVPFVVWMLMVYGAAVLWLSGSAFLWGIPSSLFNYLQNTFTAFYIVWLWDVINFILIQVQNVKAYILGFFSNVSYLVSGIIALVSYTVVKFFLRLYGATVGALKRGFIWVLNFFSKKKHPVEELSTINAYFYEIEQENIYLKRVYAGVSVFFRNFSYLLLVIIFLLILINTDAVLVKYMNTIIPRVGAINLVSLEYEDLLFLLAVLTLELSWFFNGEVSTQDNKDVIRGSNLEATNSKNWQDYIYAIKSIWDDRLVSSYTFDLDENDNRQDLKDLESKNFIFINNNQNWQLIPYINKTLEKEVSGFSNSLIVCEADKKQEITDFLTINNRYIAKEINADNASKKLLLLTVNEIALIFRQEDKIADTEKIFLNWLKLVNSLIIYNLNLEQAQKIHTVFHTLYHRLPDIIPRTIVINDENYLNTETSIRLLFAMGRNNECREVYTLEQKKTKAEVLFFRHEKVNYKIFSENLAFNNNLGAVLSLAYEANEHGYLEEGTYVEKDNENAFIDFQDKAKQENAFNKINLSSIKTNPTNIQRTTNKTLTVIDNHKNLTQTIHSVQRYGDGNLLINCLSTSYLFRDYLIKNVSYFSNNPLETLHYSESKTVVSNVVKLFLLLENNYVTEKYLMNRIASYHESYDCFLTEIVMLFKEVFGRDIVPEIEIKHDLIKINVLSSFLWNETYSLRVAQEGGEIESIAFDMVYQNYLPGQTIYKNGQRYVVNSISHGDRKIGCQQLNPKEDILEYKSTVVYSLDKLVECPLSSIINSTTTNGYKITKKKFTFSGEIKWNGYCSFESGIDIENVTDTDLSESNYTKTIIKGDCLRLSISSDKVSNDLSLTLAILLTELLPTLVSGRHKYVDIIAVNSAIGGDLKRIFPSFDVLPKSLKQQRNYDLSEFTPIDLMIFSNTHYDMGVLGHFGEEEPLKYILSCIYDYLCWWDGSKEKSDYLFFGQEKLPNDIQWEELREVLEGLGCERIIKEKVTKENYVSTSLDNCHFCFEEFQSNVLMEYADGRKICNSCTQSAITEVSQAEECVKEAKSFILNYGYSINNSLEIAVGDLKFVQSNLNGGENDTYVSGVMGFCTPGNEVVAAMGAPKDHFVCLLVHEFVHQWQFENIDDSSYDDSVLEDLQYIEGHAVWMEVEYLKSFKDKYKKHIKAFSDRDDGVYGEGFRIITRLVNTAGNNPFEILKSKFKVKES